MMSRELWCAMLCYAMPCYLRTDVMSDIDVALVSRVRSVRFEQGEAFCAILPDGVQKGLGNGPGSELELESE